MNSILGGEFLVGAKKKNNYICHDPVGGGFRQTIQVLGTQKSIKNYPKILKLVDSFTFLSRQNNSILFRETKKQKKNIFLVFGNTKSCGDRKKAQNIQLLTKVF